VKILHVITGLLTNGVKTSLYYLLANTDREYYHPVAVTLMDVGVVGQKIQALGIEVHPIGISLGFPTVRCFNQVLDTTKSIERLDLNQGWEYQSRSDQHGCQPGSLPSTLRSPCSRIRLGVAAIL